eukprot:4260625-Prymnesium_polylepis.1
MRAHSIDAKLLVTPKDARSARRLAMPRCTDDGDMASATEGGTEIMGSTRDNTGLLDETTKRRSSTYVREHPCAWVHDRRRRKKACCCSCCLFCVVWLWWAGLLSLNAKNNIDLAADEFKHGQLTKWMRLTLFDEARSTQADAEAFYESQ